MRVASLGLENISQRCLLKLIFLRVGNKKEVEGLG
jgi:hypothetical protein